MHDFPINPSTNTLSFYIVFMAHHIKLTSISQYLSGITSLLEHHFPISHINLAWNNVQLPTLLLSPYLNTGSLFIHGFPSFIQRSSSEQPSAHSFQSSCLTQ